jgi:hypothetical protein
VRAVCELQANTPKAAQPHPSAEIRNQSRRPPFRCDEENSQRKGRHVIFESSDGTEVEFHVLTPADALAALTGSPDDNAMFVRMIRLAVEKSEDVLQRLAGLPDPIGETAFLGSEILLASLLAHERQQTAGGKPRG